MPYLRLLLPVLEINLPKDIGKNLNILRQSSMDLCVLESVMGKTVAGVAGIVTDFAKKH